MTEGTHRDAAELAAGLDHVRASPADGGTVALVVARPGAGDRTELAEGRLDPEVGLVGDDWRARGSRHTEDGSAELERQLTLMNDRAATLFAVDPARRALAGDQLYVDLDLSEATLPAGSRLRVGTALVEITEKPHTGCAKFVERFGPAAARLVNQPEGRALRLRGVNARVVEAGTVRPGDAVTRAQQPGVRPVE